MEERTLQALDWAVMVGEYSVERLLSLELTSSRLSPFDVLQLAVDNEEGRAVELVAGDVVHVGIGDSENGPWWVFGGEAEEVQPERVLRLRARDGMLRLSRHEVTRSWSNVTPQEVARTVLGELGVLHTIHDASLPRRHHVVARGESAMELLQSMARAWGLDWDLYCEPDGSVWWGPWESSPRYLAALSDELVVLEHGVSVFSLEPTGEGVGVAETWLMPELAHSRLIGLNDARFWRTQVYARIERVRHRLCAKGAPGGRTTVEWRLAA